MGRICRHSPLRSRRTNNTRSFGGFKDFSPFPPTDRPTDRRRRRRRSKFAFRRGAVPPTSFRPPARTTASPLLFLIRLAAAASVSPAPTACAKTIRERGRTERGATKCNEVSRSQNRERWTTGDEGCPLLGREHRCWLGFFQAPHSLLFHTQGN